MTQIPKAPGQPRPAPPTAEEQHQEDVEKAHRRQICYEAGRLLVECPTLMEMLEKATIPRMPGVAQAFAGYVDEDKMSPAEMVMFRMGQHSVVDFIRGLSEVKING